MKKAIVAALGLLAVSFSAASAGEIVRASFNDDGTVNAPKNWRYWVFVGSPVTPHALNNGHAGFPEFHNVYVEPSAFEYWSKHGEWAEGSQFVKELTLVRTGENCHEDGSCDEASGRGYFNAEFSGLELLVKDSKRFADQPGGWGFFNFGHHAPPYAETSPLMPTDKCSFCHEASAETDFIFTQFYPLLQVSKPSE
ncbi:MAG: cytochrome P460 family protein [Sphingomonadales bacterium]